RECLHRRQLYALRSICDGLLLWPDRRGDAPTQVGERFLGQVDAEWTDRKLGGCRFVGFGVHTRSPLCCYMTDESCDGEVPPLVNVSVERSDANVYCSEEWRAHNVPAIPPLHLAQGSERRAQLGGEGLRLFPRGEVPALVGLVEVDE